MGLLARPLGQFGPADSSREAEIIFDLGTRAGLAAHSEAFDHGSLQAFGRGIDGGAQAGGTGTIDGKVVFRTRRIAKPAEFFGNLTHGRAFHACAIREDADRQSRIIHALQTQFGARLLIVAQFDPVEGDVAAL